MTSTTSSATPLSTSMVSTTHEGGIRIIAISALLTSSISSCNKRMQRSSGVHETGSSPKGDVRVVAHREVVRDPRERAPLDLRHRPVGEMHEGQRHDALPRQGAPRLG